LVVCEGEIYSFIYGGLRRVGFETEGRWKKKKRLENICGFLVGYGIMGIEFLIAMDEQRLREIIREEIRPIREEVERMLPEMTMMKDRMNNIDKSYHF
jgi:hypothetical protein